LEEEYETNPLVVLVVFDFVIFIMAGHAGMRHIYTRPTSQSIRYGKRRIDPAVCVHNSEGYFIDYAINWVTNVLSRRNQQRKCNQDDYGGFVMKPEHVVVYAYRV
jgi:hypothetical protein